ncbi:MAG: ABC transporter ATP-binding protein [Promethearchaeota archaeon]
MRNNKIEVLNLTKIYKLKGNQTIISALKDVTLSVKAGEIFGLLGPNGAGKTTMIQILTTIKQPTSGEAFIDGYSTFKNPIQVRAKIGLMLESKMLYNRITAYDNLKFFCKIYKIQNYKEKINEIVKDFELEDWLHQYVEKFSSGMKMKLALCRTLLLDRKILFLDEPTLGLDVKTKEFIVNKLTNLNYTIFLTSHDMGVVEKICDRIAFINKGKIIKIGTKSDIENLLQTQINIDIHIVEDKNELKSELNQEDFILDIVDINNGFTVIIKSRDFYQDLLLILSKYKILKVKEHESSLGDLFLKLVR